MGDVGWVSKITAPKNTNIQIAKQHVRHFDQSKLQDFTKLPGKFSNHMDKELQQDYYLSANLSIRDQKKLFDQVLQKNYFKKSTYFRADSKGSDYVTMRSNKSGD